MMLRHVDLCSGIGGFALGFHWAKLSEPVLFCDTEPWCRQILNKNFPNIPIATDVKELANDPERLVPDHEILSCGYPCQPFSVAGLRKGEEDDRHIWPSIFRIITHKRPSWVVCENVYGHVALGLDKVLFDMESQGYATRTFIVPACAKNAPHRRDRLWIICKNVGDTESRGRGEFRESSKKKGNESCQIDRGQSIGSSRVRTNVGDTEYNGSSSSEIRRSYQENAGGSQKREIETEQSQRTSGRGDHEVMADTECLGWEQRSEVKGEFDRERSPDQSDFSSEGCRGSRSSTSLADTESKGLQGWSQDTTEYSKWIEESSSWNKSFGEETNIWNVEPNVGRVAHGIPKRVDRLKGLGNAIVPQLAMQIGLAIKSDLS
jgi:DNA (cytosine-5)-methyltransferase 1